MDLERTLVSSLLVVMLITVGLQCVSRTPQMLLLMGSLTSNLLAKKTIKNRLLGFLIRQPNLDPPKTD